MEIRKFDACEKKQEKRDFKEGIFVIIKIEKDNLFKELIKNGDIIDFINFFINNEYWLKANKFLL